jgi:hypothetical protein
LAALTFNAFLQPLKPSDKSTLRVVAKAMGDCGATDPCGTFQITLPHEEKRSFLEQKRIIGKASARRI